MFSSPFLLVVLTGAAIAFTQAGFEPVSTNNLSVIFGNTLAVNGKEIPKVAGGQTSELLHWMQPGLVSVSNSTFVGGVQILELVNPSNASAFATYIQPSSPNIAPNTHGYIQLLLNTTGINSALSKLSKFAATRTNFSAVNVVKAAGLTVLAGNSFNVTNITLTQANITNTSGPAPGVSSTVTRMSMLNGPAATGAANGSTNSTAPKIADGVPNVSESKGAYIAGLGALAAAVMML